MKLIWKKQAIFILILMVSLIVSGAEANETKKITESFQVSPSGQLILETDLGSVEVMTGDNDRVEVEILIEARTRSSERAEDIFNAFNVKFDQQGEDVEIIAEYDSQNKRRWFGNSDNNKLQVEYYITVPREYNISVETQGGSIIVRELKGAVKVYTAGGSLAFEAIDGQIHGQTSGGSIDLAECTGDVDINTSGGSISIGRVAGDVEAHTSGGSILVEEAMGMLNASTSGGSIKARLTRGLKNDCRLTTSGGSVTVYLVENAAIDLDAKTSSGHVDMEFKVSLEGRICDSAIRGALNGGGPELYLRTSGGNIYLRKL